MPGVYREKICPHCAVKHRKRGPFCSKECSNSNREPTENIRNNMRKVATEYNRTPEGIAQQKLLSTGLLADDFAIEIPEFGPDLSDYGDYERGEDW